MTDRLATTRLEEIRKAWRDAHVAPLWETNAHTGAKSIPRAYL
jgi:hypothetical protein